jgi:cell division protein FtsI/penicillin-binding protein 2
MARLHSGWKAVAVAGGLAAAVGLASRASGSPDKGAKIPAAAIANVATTPKPPAVLIGDASLQGKVEIDKLVREGEHLVAPLVGGGKAVLTLDPKLQAAAEKVLERAKAPLGAIVVTATDGRVLAYAGRRNREPANVRDFSLPAKVWAPAASIFKVVTSAALLAKGVSPKAKVCYSGGIRSVDPHHLTDNPKRDQACETLSFGLAKSQNAIIAKLSNRHLDKKTLRKYAQRFGFDKEIPFALSTEASSCNLPDEPLEFARTCAGFWNTELSPLGGAVLANVVASGGLHIMPRIVAEVRRGDGVVLPVVGPAPRRVLKKKVAADLASMMERAVSRGTARKGFHTRRGKPFLGEIKVAGKTGSLSKNDPYTAYSWFVGFAPADEPEYVISVLLGNPMKWHLKGHTAARLVLQEAFSGRK